jgi:glycerol-3-phosphate dehydrogenase (NAD(P)+)
MNETYQKFGVIGAGAWGTALALCVHRAGRDVLMWAKDTDVSAAINNGHENTKRLPGIPLDKTIRATSNLADMAAMDALILAIPAQSTRSMCRDLRALGIKIPVILAAKGIEQGTSALLTNIVRDEIPDCPVGLISGPSFATEVARGLPTALTLGVEDPKLGEKLAMAMSSPTTFRLYYSGDIIGVQVGGALKNVLAIACGIVVGRSLGENARAALMTRGIAEIMRFGIALGARAETLMGLSGLGDVALTCSSAQSRNMALGIALGQGASLAALKATNSNLTEGVATAGAALELARKHNVEMPIMAAVDAVVNHGASIETQVSTLMARPLKSEIPNR